MVILLIFFLLIGILYYDSNTRLVTTEFKLSYPNLPDAFDGYRIVLLADLHGAEHGDDNERLIEAVKAADPDIIAIAGDLIDRYQAAKPVEKQLEIAQTLVSQLVTVAPVYYVTGNHEWDSGMVRSLLEMLRDSGVDVLQNKYRLLERSAASGENTGSGSIILAGIEDPSGPADMIKPSEFIEKIKDNEDADFILVLYHRNYNLSLFSRLGVDLVLSGHSHGGMVRLPFTDGLIGPQMELFPTHTSGVYTSGATDMVVSRGLGNQLGWTRFLNNPEVVVVELRST